MNETVTIPRADYEALVEASELLADLQAHDTARSALATGAEELLPTHVANRLIDGDNPLRVYREHRGLTQVALSEASGVNRVQIADIESGRKTGSVTTLRKLADALSVGLDDLVP
ncbi:helix-turn-helix transcriptional regulator [Oceanicola sp. D3]|uniref:helix-turn-helix transcriptional regulator n=1 Tax=Oceanicola sp. D3 TaxID=2587163 RepID=UPI0011220A29|nr:helix-turn-helix transcriptional regulator [Oceanicola sp. D3]QDC10385.1 helix-turn-helix transcriptional regulator [Oceanicola sp. D3]